MASNLRVRHNNMVLEGRKKMVCVHEKVLFSDEETPQWNREPFIKSGYRQTYSTFWQCIQSLFYLHNQSFNIWSHLLATLYFLVRFAVALNESCATLDPLNLPLLSAAIGTITLYSTSAAAHLLNSMSEKAYKTCFFFDYAGISIYSFTSSQAVFFYTRPVNSNWIIFESPRLYLSIASLVSCFSTYTCCKTDAGSNKFSALLRTISFLAALLNTALPFIAGVTFCSCHTTEPCLALAGCSSLSLNYYAYYVICLIFGGLIYSSRIPERFFPGTFDFIGNSHHFLHILASLGTEFAFRVIEMNMKQAKNKEILAIAMVDVSFWNTLCLSLLIPLVNAGIVVWFARAPSGHTSAKKWQQFTIEHFVYGKPG